VKLLNIFLILFIVSKGFTALGQEPGTLKWSYATTGEIYSSPAVDMDGVIYVGVNDDSEDGVNDNKVIAVNPDGTLKWETEVGDWVDSSPALAPGGVLYVGSWEGFLYALDTETGSELWKFESFGVIDGSPAVGKDGVIYFGNGENALYAVNPDGTPVWTIASGPNAGDASPFLFDDWVDGSPTLDDDGNVWVGDLFGNFSQIAPDKTELWSVDLGFGIPTSPAIAEDGTIYIADNDGFVIAVTPGVEAPKWAFNTGLSGIESSPIIGPDGTVYIGTSEDSIYAFDGQTGAVKPGWPFTDPTDVVYSTPAIAENGTVYVGSGDRNLYAISSGGAKLWSYQTGGFVDSSPAIGPDGTIYVGSTDGKLYAIYGDSPLSFSSRWPKYRGSLEANGCVDPYRKWIEDEDVAEANPLSDPDNDGLENILEWGFCTNPNVAGWSDVKFPFTVLTGEGLVLEAEWLEDARGMGYEFSDNLFDWNELDLDSPESYTWFDSLSIEDLGTKKRTQLHLNILESPPKFFRLTGTQH